MNSWKLSTFCLAALMVACGVELGRAGFAEFFGGGGSKPVETRLSLNYLKINEHLLKSVNTDNSEANMEAAVRWLSSLKSKSPLPEAERPIVQALELFTSLERVLQEGVRCTEESFRILHENSQASLGGGNLPPSSAQAKLAQLNRVEQMVYNYTRDHALECQNVYPFIFRTKIAQMDEQLVERVNQAVDRLISLYLFYYKNQLTDLDSQAARDKLAHWQHLDATNLTQFLENESYEAIKALIQPRFFNLHREQRGEAAYVYHAVRAVALKDPQRTSDFDDLTERDQIKHLFEKYLHEPCDYYYHQLGPQLFYLVTKDSYALEKGFLEEEFKDHLDFFLGWSRYQLCSSISSKSYRTLLNELIGPDDENDD